MMNELRLMLVIWLLGRAAALVPMDDARSKPLVDMILAPIKMLEA